MQAIFGVDKPVKKASSISELGWTVQQISDLSRLVGGIKTIDELKDRDGHTLSELGEGLRILVIELRHLEPNLDQFSGSQDDTCQFEYQPTDINSLTRRVAEMESNLHGLVRLLRYDLIPAIELQHDKYSLLFRSVELRCPVCKAGCYRGGRTCGSLDCVIKLIEVYLGEGLVSGSEGAGAEPPGTDGLVGT